jgi:hypothetical protein
MTENETSASEERGIEAVSVLEWKYADVSIADGTGRLPHRIATGPRAMMVRCNMCNSVPWRVTEGPVPNKTHFAPAGMSVSVYCPTCEKLWGLGVSDLPGYVEAHSR